MAKIYKTKKIIIFIHLFISHGFQRQCSTLLSACSVTYAWRMLHNSDQNYSNHLKLEWFFFRVIIWKSVENDNKKKKKTQNATYFIIKLLLDVRVPSKIWCMRTWWLQNFITFKFFCNKVHCISDSTWKQK